MDPNPSSTPRAINGSNGLKAPPNNPELAVVPPGITTVAGTFPVPVPVVPVPVVDPVPGTMPFTGATVVMTPPPVPGITGITGPINLPAVVGGCSVDPPPPVGVVPPVKIGIEMVVDEPPSKLA